MSERKYIDATPTWRAVLPLLVEAAANGDTSEARANAMLELQRMADIADAAIAEHKAMKKGGE